MSSMYKSAVISHIVIVVGNNGGVCRVSSFAAHEQSAFTITHLGRSLCFKQRRQTQLRDIGHRCKKSPHAGKRYVGAAREADLFYARERQTVCDQNCQEADHLLCREGPTIKPYVQQRRELVQQRRHLKALPLRGFHNLRYVL